MTKCNGPLSRKVKHGPCRVEIAAGVELLDLSRGIKLLPTQYQPVTRLFFWWECTDRGSVSIIATLRIFPNLYAGEDEYGTIGSAPQKWVGDFLWDCTADSIGNVDAVSLLR